MLVSCMIVVVSPLIMEPSRIILLVDKFKSKIARIIDKLKNEVIDTLKTL